MLYLCLQYFVFDFHDSPSLLFDKTITLTVSRKNFIQKILFSLNLIQQISYCSYSFTLCYWQAIDWCVTGNARVRNSRSWGDQTRKFGHWPHDWRFQVWRGHGLRCFWLVVIFCALVARSWINRIDCNHATRKSLCLFVVVWDWKIWCFSCTGRLVFNASR